jgi:DNA-directed RNA polymerase specialized sigma24 family protein
MEVFYGERHDARDALRVVVGTESIDRLTSALVRLPKSHRDAWIHARLSGDSQSTTAYELGMTRVMVKKALDRDDRQLKEVLTEVRAGY